MTRSVVCQNCLSKLLNNERVPVLGLPGPQQFVLLDRQTMEIVWPEGLKCEADEFEGPVPNPAKRKVGRPPGKVAAQPSVIG